MMIQDCMNCATNTNSTSNTFVADNNWHFIVGVKQGNNYSIYVDGVLESTVSGLCSFSGSNLNMMLGTHLAWVNQGGDDWFDGLIDNVSIWDIALTQQEIQNYLNCPLLGSEIGLVGYWNFEEGSGNTCLLYTSPSPRD